MLSNVTVESPVSEGDWLLVRLGWRLLEFGKNRTLFHLDNADDHASTLSSGKRDDSKCKSDGHLCRSTAIGKELAIYLRCREFLIRGRRELRVPSQMLAGHS